MRWRRIAPLLRKEWLETLHNRTLTVTFAGLAAMFVGLPIALAFVIPALGPELIASNADDARLTGLLAQALPGYLELEPIQQFQVFMLRQFLVLFLILPVMGAISIATYSIIGEKTSRSLEALLATPIRTDELLLAKTLAAAAPAIAGTWVAFGLFATLVRVLGGEGFLRFVIDPAAWALVGLMVPLVAFFGLGAGVIVSSRSKDPRSAQQVAGLLVLPLVFLIVGQASGVFLLGLQSVLLGAVVLAVVDAALLWAGARLFDRESMLTRWR